MNSFRYWLAGTLTAICLAVSANAQILSQVINSVAISGITGLGTNQSTFLAAALTVNGALALNGSGTPSQAASTNLSDTTAATTWTPTDASSAALTFTSPSGNFSKSNKTCVGTLRVTYPVTADATTAKINLPCTIANNGNMAAGSCWTTSATTANSILILLVNANTAVTFFVNSTGGGTSPTNAALSTLIVSCSFAFITT